MPPAPHPSVERPHKEGEKLRFRATLAGGADPAVSSIVLPGDKIRVIIVSSTALAELLE